MIPEHGMVKFHATFLNGQDEIKREVFLNKKFIYFVADMPSPKDPDKNTQIWFGNNSMIFAREPITQVLEMIK